jgi:hypothetical protein
MSDTDKRRPAQAVVEAHHKEIEQTYAWRDAGRKRDQPPRDKNYLLTRIRLRQLERLYYSRYGRTLPEDDDAGREDLEIAAHHIFFLGGNVVDHIIKWASLWAPWMSPVDAEQMARRVAARPRKWLADSLAAELSLTMAERTALGITTIGAIDVDKAARDELRKLKNKLAMRASRAARSSGRPPGRPRKTPCTADIRAIGVHGVFITLPLPPMISSRQTYMGGNYVCLTWSSQHQAAFAA